MTTEMTTLHCTSPLARHCTLSTPTSTFTECAHARIVSSASYTSSILTLAQVRALSALHPHVIHVCDLFTLISTLSTSQLSSCPSSSSLSSTSTTSSSPSSTRRSWKTCYSATNGCEGTYDVLYSPQVMSPTAMTSTSSRTHRSPSPTRSLPRTRTWMT